MGRYEVIKKFKEEEVKGYNLFDAIIKYKEKYASDWKMEINLKDGFIYFTKNGYLVNMGFYISSVYRGNVYVKFYLHSVVEVI